MLRNAKAGDQELRKLLEPLVRGGKSGALSAFLPTNHLIITDTAENIRQIERIRGWVRKARPGVELALELLPLIPDRPRLLDGLEVTPTQLDAGFQERDPLFQGLPVLVPGW